MSNEETLNVTLPEEEPLEKAPEETPASEPPKENVPAVELPKEEEPEEEVSEEIPVIEIPEEELVTESTEEVVLIRKHDAAVRYLRKQDCEMIRILRDHLAENIRLHNILNGIKAEIAALNERLRTPKPKFKAVLFIFGLIIAAAGYFFMSHSEMDTLQTILYAVIGVGAIMILVPIILKLVGNHKWKMMIEATLEELRIKEAEAAKAQQDIDEYWANHAQPYIASITPDRFPTAYARDYDTVCGMLFAMENLRADTVKEAINLYDEISFRNRMKAAFRSMESSLKESARSAERSAQAAERSAAANESAAASAASIAASAAAASAASIRASKASADASKAIKDSVNRS